ncbi:MAG: ribosome maturation factor RimP [Alphaproteobacteria bacterium]
MHTTDRIEQLLEPVLTPYGYNIVRVHLSGAQRPVLQIMIEHLDDSAITVDDCTRVSRIVSAHVDVADPIQAAFVLEVSSPGLDRPLVKPKDYQRFCGREVVVVLAMPLQGRKRFLGRLEQATEEEITLIYKADKSKTDETETLLEQKIRITDIKTAKLYIDFAKL